MTHRWRGAYGMCVAFALITSPGGNAQAQSGPQRSLAQCGKTESFLLANPQWAGLAGARTAR
jgi:hypothetical protein